MTMESDLTALLRAAPAVTALVGNRIEWLERVQGRPLPAISLQVISKTGGHMLARPEDLKVARVQVDCWASTYPQAKALEAAAEMALDGYSGGALHGVLLDVARELREGGTTEADRPFRVSMDFMVHFNRS